MKTTTDMVITEWAKRKLRQLNLLPEADIDTITSATMYIDWGGDYTFGGWVQDTTPTVAISALWLHEEKQSLIELGWDHFEESDFATEVAEVALEMAASEK